MAILFPVKREMAILFFVKRDLDPPFTTLFLLLAIRHPSAMIPKKTKRKGGMSRVTWRPARSALVHT